jgi:Fe-S-cluster containining protein
LTEAADREPAVRLLRYVTLAAARALECNGCGDCCDSRRTDGFWTWGDLPADQYSSICGGVPLVIPIERSEDGWRDRPYQANDASTLSGSRFRCVAFQPQPDGGGRCGRHQLSRPSKCGEFPVWGAGIEVELRETGAAAVQVGAFPRCTWYGMVVVADDDPRAQLAANPMPSRASTARGKEVTG